MLRRVYHELNGKRIARALLLPKSEPRIGGTVLRMEHKDPAQVRFEEEMFRAAVTDPLTGVPDRRAFEEPAPAEVARARRHGVPVSAVFVDIDHFKKINDLHGNAVGVSAYRTGDTVASLLGRADAALYGAKSGGRNRVEREA